MKIPFWFRYARLLRAVLETGVREKNHRTGSLIAALPEGASFAIDLSDGILPTCGLRKTRPHIAAAELAWCLLGHNHVDWLRKHTKVWDDFADVRDCASCEGSGLAERAHNIIAPQCPNCDGSGRTFWLEQAYGWRWRAKFGVDQLHLGIERLRADASDRRVWISSWDPGEDIVAKGQKTVPCPVGFTLSVMDGKLNSTLMIRSSDLYMGLPYDVARHALLMSAVAVSLNKQPGHMRVTLAHPHIYEQHFENCYQMLERDPVIPQMNMFATWGVDAITKQPDAYVASVKQYAASYVWPAFNPKAEVVR